MMSTEQGRNTKVLQERAGNRPILPSGPIQQPVYRACFICNVSEQSLLRDLTIYIHPEQFGIVAQMRDCFGINLPQRWIRNLKNMKICTTCRLKLNKAVEFRYMVEDAVNSECCEMQDTSARTSLVLGKRPLLQVQESSCRIAKKVCQRRAKHSEVAECTVEIDPSDHSYHKDGPGDKASGLVDLTKNTELVSGKETSVQEEGPKPAIATEHGYCAESLQEQTKDIGKRSLQRLCDFVTSKKTSLSLVERCKLIAVLRNCDNSEYDIAMAIMTSPVIKAIEAAILNDISSIASHLCSLNLEPGPSVLRKMPTARSPVLQQEDILLQGTLELARSMPFVMDLLVTLCSPPMPIQKDMHRTVGLIYGVAMHTRLKNLCALQKVNTLVAASMHASYELLSNLSKLRLTVVDPSKVIAAQRKIGAVGFTGERGKPAEKKKLPNKPVRIRKKRPVSVKTEPGGSDTKCDGAAQDRETERPNNMGTEQQCGDQGDGDGTTANMQSNNEGHHIRESQTAGPEASQQHSTPSAVETVEETIVLDHFELSCD